MPPENNTVNPTAMPPVTPTPIPQTPPTPVEPMTPPTPPTPPVVNTPTPSTISETVKSNSSSGSFMSLLLIPILLILGMGTSLALVYFFPDVFESLGIIKEQETENTDDNTQKDAADNEIQIAQKTERISCPEWVYADEDHKDQYYIDIKYEDLGGVTFTNVVETCSGVEMNYKTGTLFLTYSHGEAFQQNLPEDREMTTVETRDVGGQTVVLARATDGVQLEGDAYGDLAPGKLYQYVQLFNDAASCDGTELDANLKAPCFFGGNPFIDVTGEFVLYIPDSTSAAEKNEILQFFDFVATHSSSYNYNTDAAAEI